MVSLPYKKYATKKGETTKNENDLPKSFLEFQLVKEVAIISFHWAPL